MNLHYYLNQNLVEDQNRGRGEKDMVEEMEKELQEVKEIKKKDQQEVEGRQNVVEEKNLMMRGRVYNLCFQST